MTPRRLCSSWLIVCASSTAWLASLASHAQEVRGTWLTTTGPDHISSGFNTETIVGQLRDVGLNTLYIEAWKNGRTQFHSPTLDAFVGRTLSPTPSQRSVLEEVTIQAHRNRQIAVAWFEYGFAAQFIGSGGSPSNTLANKARNEGWLLQDQSGQYGNASNGFAWMNPAVPEVRELLIGLALDAARTYDLDGLQFDDRLAWPREFGWDSTTAALYLAETGRPLPASIHDAHFRGWRQSKVTQFATELTTALRTNFPDLHLSVSPSVRGFSDVNFNAPWQDWVAQGLFDEYVPQVYRTTLSSFRATLPDNIVPFENADRLGELVVGVRLNGTGADTPLADYQQMIVDAALAENGQLAGHSTFYSKGLIENAAAMQAFYGNQMDNPFFDPDRRPDALVATELGATDVWRVQVSEALTYRVVAEISGLWLELDSLDFAAGTHDLVAPAGATQVELLVDCRGSKVIPEPASAMVVGAAGLGWLRRGGRRRGAVGPVSLCNNLRRRVDDPQYDLRPATPPGAPDGHHRHPPRRNPRR